MEVDTKQRLRVALDGLYYNLNDLSDEAFHALEGSLISGNIFGLALTEALLEAQDRNTTQKPEDVRVA